MEVEEHVARCPAARVQRGGEAFERRRCTGGEVRCPWECRGSVAAAFVGAGRAIAEEQELLGLLPREALDHGNRGETG